MRIQERRCRGGQPRARPSHAEAMAHSVALVRASAALLDETSKILERTRELVADASPVRAATGTAPPNGASSRRVSGV